jgi:AbiV family abortive infection protein
MPLNYEEGFGRCVESAKAHAGVAHLLRGMAYELGASKDVAGIAVSHAALAEEEAAKAAFCAMVSVGLAPPEILDPPFQDHAPKTYLYYALANRKILDIRTVGRRTTVTIGGQPIDAAKLRGVWDEKISELREHNDDRNAGFYVRKTDNEWLSPGEGCTGDPMALVYRYLLRAQVVLSFCQVLLRKPLVSEISSLRVEETPGGWSLSWNEI